MSDASRDTILRALRSQPTPDLALPAPWNPPDDMRLDPAERVTRFAQALESAAGTLVQVPTGDDLEDHLTAVSSYATAQSIASSIEGAATRANVDLANVAGPRELAHVDFALVAGSLGVAENGSVWLDAGRLPDRALPFLTQHLGIVLHASDLVDDLHQAYQRLHFETPGFGTFVTGPSKTADIEQALVIGAHGARSLCVLLVGEPTSG
ncbi:LUD domain-containing protein [Myxococcota bacterium]|nr:LUD domain-containing protein [Myxococcota bacterium]